MQTTTQQTNPQCTTPGCVNLARGSSPKAGECWPCYTIIERERRDADYAFVGPRELLGEDRVTCPTCRAPAGVACRMRWNPNGGRVHEMRYRAAASEASS